MNIKNRLIAKLRKEFPEVKYKKVKLITKGWDHDVLILDNKLVFRFPKKKLYKNSFHREIKFLREFLKISNLRVPDYIFLAKDKNFGGYEIIKGEELTPQKYSKLSAKQKQKIIMDLAKFVSLLHNIPLKKAEHHGFEKCKPWRQDLKEKQKWFEDEFKVKVGNKLSKEENVFIENFISHHSNPQYFKPALGHYDLSHDHIFINQDGSISGIIDFGDLAIGDPSREFNGFYDYNEKMPAQVYKLYEGPKDKDFLKRSREHFIHRWIYLLYDSLVRRKNKTLWKEARQRLEKIIKQE
ncbi:MAG: aminoglycoside phosphotransferase family protein [Patescibacteria group bacterium]|nr:aminoglycoside phosphotransferase family protein [Patescibacteria group bacterium]